jgi:hypothetical protein
MGTRLSILLYHLSRGWVVVAALLIFITFTALVAPGQAALAESYAGDTGSPDLSVFYTVEQLYHMAETYGEHGRAAYVRARFTFDLAFPVIYALSLVTALGWLSRRAFNAGSLWQRANLVPILAMLFDYGENVSASLVMARYPERTPPVDWLATEFTLLKWAFIAASFALLLALAAAALWRRANRKR